MQKKSVIKSRASTKKKMIQIHFFFYKIQQSFINIFIEFLTSMLVLNLFLNFEKKRASSFIIRSYNKINEKKKLCSTRTKSTWTE